MNKPPEWYRCFYAALMGLLTSDKHDSYEYNLKAAILIADWAGSELSMKQDIISTATGLPEGFIPWAGGECPSVGGKRVSIVRRDGLPQPYPDYVSFFSWEHTNHGSDIIGYRVEE